MKSAFPYQRFSLKQMFATAFALVGLVGAPSASAGVITVGVQTPGAENSLPFGVANSIVRYQQIYGSAAFGALTEPVLINSIGFFAKPTLCGFFGCFPQTQSVSSGTYTVKLSTTAKAVDGLDFAMNGNVGSDVHTFFSGALSDTLTISGTPFLYDRSLGNLIMDITVHGQTANWTYLDASAARNDHMSRLWSTTGSSAATNGAASARSIGLVTQFDFSLQAVPVVVAVPVPGSILLCAGGLLALGLTRSRRRVASRS